MAVKAWHLRSHTLAVRDDCQLLNDEKRKNLHIKVKAIIIQLMPAIIKTKACSNTCIAWSYILGTVVVSSRALFLIFETDFSTTIVSSLVGWLCSCQSTIEVPSEVALAWHPLLCWEHLQNVSPLLPS